MNQITQKRQSPVRITATASCEQHDFWQMHFPHFRATSRVS